MCRMSAAEHSIAAFWLQRVLVFACSAVFELRSEICIIDQLMVGLVVRNHYKPKNQRVVKPWHCTEFNVVHGTIIKL